MFQGNTAIATTTRKQNPRGAGALVVALIVAGVGYVGYRLFGKKAKAAEKPPYQQCPEGQIWSESDGKCIPHLEKPEPKPTPPPTPTPTPEQEYIEVMGYQVPVPPTPTWMMRRDVGELPLSEAEQPYEEGRRVGMIVAWPKGYKGAPAAGGEYIWARVASFTPTPAAVDPDPLTGNYRVQILSKFQGDDVAPKLSQYHGQQYGKYIDLSRVFFLDVFPKGAA